MTLIAMDERGEASTQKRETVTVVMNRPPRADFSAKPQRGDGPLTVTFTDRSSDPDGDGLSWRWDFGDGTRSTERNPTHTYTRAGKFEVSLTVIDNKGARSEQPKRKTIEVEK